MVSDLHEFRAEGVGQMWLQRVLFNFQTRLLGRSEQQTIKKDVSKNIKKPILETDRVQIMKSRLLDLDRRLAELR